MAPVKRSKTDVSNAKRLKPDPMLEGVTASIELSSLPVGVKTMLLQLAPLSLSTPADKRHDFQRKVVDMVGEIVVQVQRTMKKDIDAKEEAASERSRARNELLSVVRHAEVSKVEKVSASDALATSLADITKSLVDKKLDWQVAQEDQRVADTKHAADVAVAESLAAGVEAHLVPILAGATDRKDAEAHFQALMPFISSLEIDLSLSSALKTSCTKPCAERSAFDKLVVQELESALRSHLDTLQGAVSSGISGLASRAAAVDATRQEHDTLDEKHQAAHAASVIAQKLADEAGDTLSAAQTAIAKFDAEHADAERELAKTKGEYDNFLVWNVECYTKLKEKTSGRSVDTVIADVSKISEPIQEDPVMPSSGVIGA
uniref:Uncharacterized protein n=1 Tax=Noctiluca scintillans TaxID=2966 RepID=A0A6T9E845_NOCSC|mmetsp:Transcript_51599/g.137728  ORF Transcript_51599/g.137728 Transcript_51599/m.137728 type:complete len:375 (+) Transcript_51599:59-1183(+)